MANRYWVGGTGTWNDSDTSHWSDSSGGASGFSVPTSSDAVILDASSGGGIITLGYSPSMLSLTMGSYVGTLTIGANDITLGSLDNSGTGVRTINFGSGNWFVTGSGSVWNENSVTNFTRNVQTSTIDYAYSGSNTVSTGCRAYNNMKRSAGTGIFVTPTSNQSVVGYWDFTGFSGTYTKGTGIPNISGNLTLSPTMTVTAGTTSIDFGGSGTQTLTTNGVIINLPLNKSGTGTLNLGSDLDITGVNANAFSATVGTFTTNNYNIKAHTVSFSSASVRTINLGSSTIELTGNNATILNVTTTTNLTLNVGTSTVNCTYSGSTGTRTITGGSAVTLPNILVSAGSDAFTLTASTNVTDLNFTGYTGTLASGAHNIAGSLTLGTGMTVTAGANTWTFTATSSKTIQTNGVICNKAFTFNGVGGSWTLLDNLDITGANGTSIILTNGTFSASTFDVKAFSFSSSNSNVRTLNMGSGTWEITGSIGTLWTLTTSTNMTLNAGTSTLKFSATQTGTMTFQGGGLTYSNFWYACIGGGNAFVIGGANTFSRFKANTGANLQFQAGVSNSSYAWDIVGTSGSHMVALRSATTLSAATLVKLGGGTVQLDYIDNVRDITATPNTPNVFYASNSVNSSNNTGITFGTAPSTPNNGMMLLI